MSNKEIIKCMKSHQKNECLKSSDFTIDQWSIDNISITCNSKKNATKLYAILTMLCDAYDFVDAIHIKQSNNGYLTDEDIEELCEASIQTLKRHFNGGEDLPKELHKRCAILFSKTIKAFQKIEMKFDEQAFISYNLWAAAVINLCDDIEKADFDIFWEKVGSNND